MWCCLVIIMDPRYKLVTFMVIIDEIFTNMNKLDQLDEFNSKVKENLYKLFDEYIN